MSTIKDLARHTNLSIATVSKFLNGGNVLPENRILLENAVKKLHYRMNHIARGLKTRRSMTIGVLIPRFDNYFYSNMISTIETLLSRKGYSAITCAYQDEAEMEKEKLDFLLGKSVDGIIFVPLGAKSGCLPVIKKTTVPIVMIDRACAGIKCDAVLSDNQGAMRQAVEYLHSFGHRRIGIILGPEGVYTADERYVGFCRAVAELKLDTDPRLIRRGNYRTESGSQCINDFMQLSPRPTAIIVTNCEMTVGAFVGLETAKIKVPEQLSLIGFDNLELARAVQPHLCTIVQPVARMSENAVSLLLARIDGQAAENCAKMVFEVNIVPNASVGPVET